MKLRSALVAGVFALLMSGVMSCPCGGVSGDNGGVLGAETFYCGSGPV